MFNIFASILKSKASVKNRRNSALKTVGGKVDYSDKAEKSKAKNKSVLSIPIKLGIAAAAIHSIKNMHDTKTVQKTDAKLKEYDDNWQASRLPSCSKDGPSCNEVFNNALHRILMKLESKNNDIIKQRVIKVQERNQKLGGIAATLGSGINNLARVSGMQKICNQHGGTSSNNLPFTTEAATLDTTLMDDSDMCSDPLAGSNNDMQL